MLPRYPSFSSSTLHYWMHAQLCCRPAVLRSTGRHRSKTSVDPRADGGVNRAYLRSGVHLEFHRVRSPVVLHWCHDRGPSNSYPSCSRPSATRKTSVNHLHRRVGPTSRYPSGTSPFRPYRAVCYLASGILPRHRTSSPRASHVLRFSPRFPSSERRHHLFGHLAQHGQVCLHGATADPSMLDLHVLHGVLHELLGESVCENCAHEWPVNASLPIGDPHFPAGR